MPKAEMLYNMLSPIIVIIAKLFLPSTWSSEISLLAIMPMIQEKKEDMD